MEGMKLTSNQKTILKRRGMNPADYILVRDLYGSLWVRNIHTGKIKILNKRN